MKKLCIMLLILTLGVLALAACTSEQAVEQETPVEGIAINLGGLTGPTSMGMVKLLEDNEQGKTVNQYNFTIAGSANELTPKFIQGDLDIIAIPANLGVVLYNNTQGAAQMLAINTLGVLYIVEQGQQISSMEDLKDKTIYATGKGATPEYILRYLLQENNINPDTEVKIEWKSEPTETVAILSSDTNAIAMLPQPYVAVVQSKLPDVHISLDLNEEWDKLQNGSQMVTAALIVRKDFAEQNPEQLAAFLKEYKESTEYVNTNVSEAAVLVEKFGIVKAAIAEKAIPYCNITYSDGEEMQTIINGYFQVLFDANPKALGGKMPEAGFFYQK
ncbi:MAG: ABC transporter substrate-binding protein [Clostridia bacterium]|nr:ABC transporter substrate-binding protein [Clostridia bacterium]